MEYTLILEVPEEVYTPLRKTAERASQKLEALAVHWLAKAALQHGDDPLEKFIGAFKSNIPDWADEHDKYLGNALMKEAQGQEREGG